MSDVHDKIIADKEARIARLDEQLKVGTDALETLKNSLSKVRDNMSLVASSLKSGADILEVSIDMAGCIERSTSLVNNAGNALLKTMRDTRASFIFETNQLKVAAEDAKQFRYAASDLKSAIELINSIRPTIRELASNANELNLIQHIIHACQSTTKDRERPNSPAGEQTSPEADVQVG